MLSWYKYLIVSLVFSRLGFWSGNLFLIAPFPDHCLLVPFCRHVNFTATYIELFIEIMENPDQSKIDLILTILYCGAAIKVWVTEWPPIRK